jgi:hypothetical protein
MITTIKRSLIRGCITLFCVWHAAAVAIYTVPAEAQDPASRWTREHLAPVVRRYLLATSQWQLWNLFSPDPLRRVVRYAIETRTGDQWVPLALLNERTIPWWRDADELKILRRLEEQEDRWVQLRKRYVHEYCTLLPPGTPLRLTYQYYILPKLEVPMSLSWWRRYRPQRQPTTGIETTCPT